MHEHTNIDRDVAYRGIEEDSINNMELKAAFMLLPPRYQIVLGLLGNGLTQQNVANIMEMSRTSVGTDKKTALSILHKHISDCRE